MSSFEQPVRGSCRAARRRAALIALMITGASRGALAAPPWHTLGRALAPAEIASWDIDVRPDGVGLPPGAGSVADGQVLYDAQCASCHGVFGESNDYLALTGGIGSLASDSPQRTVGSKLNYATTLWDYINRAMPFPNSKSLTADEVYAVTAYVLNLNDIVPADAVLDRDSLPQVVMPNRDGFTEAHGLQRVDGKPDVQNTACMRDCAAQVDVSSALPEGFATEMYGDLGTHFRRFDGRAAPVAAAAPTAVELARTHGCLACHDEQQARVGPAFVAVRQRYAGDSAAMQALTVKVREGGSGQWGTALMPPQRALPDADLATILAWVLGGTPRS